MTRLAFASLLLLGPACASQDEPPTGGETGPCYPNATCDMGLSCRSDLCVALDGPDTDAAEDDRDPRPDAQDPPPPSPPPAPDDPPEVPPDEGPWGDTGDIGDTGGVPEDSCPFTEDGISCAAACTGELAYYETCIDDPYQYTLEECVAACEYTQDNDLANDLWLEIYGCMEVSGGSCDAYLDCWVETSC